MNAFPRIRFNESAMKASTEMNMKADTFYCLYILENSGIQLVTGSGFGQEEGTYHFRITILPENIEECMDKLEAANAKFHDEFA
jgi:aspartate/methionine/tyrosine aminotransferase